MSRKKPEIIIVTGPPGTNSLIRAKEIEPAKRPFDFNRQIRKRKGILVKEDLLDYFNLGYVNSNIIAYGTVYPEDIKEALSAAEESLSFSYRKVSPEEKFKVSIYVLEADREVCKNNLFVERKEQDVLDKYKDIEISESDFSDFRDRFDISIIREEVEGPSDAHIWITHLDNNVYVETKANEGYRAKTGLFITSDTWTLGGNWKNCWGSSGTVYADSQPKEFNVLFDFIERSVGDISMKTWRDLKERCVTVEDYERGDCYGGSVSYAHYCCDVEKLYKFLKERQLIDA